MISRGMFVRCPDDNEYPDAPHVFSYGKVSEVDPFSNRVKVTFFDTNGCSLYYDIPEERWVSEKLLEHVKARIGAKIIYSGKTYSVLACQQSVDDSGFFVYAIKDGNNQLTFAQESEMLISFNDGVVNPLSQMRNYELQNPKWFFSRYMTAYCSGIIDSAMAGFPELMGCKIFLKPYQLMTVKRCLEQNSCRLILADEVGLGKTIEALAVLKIFLNNRFNQKVVILVPDEIVEQWETEMAFKFRIFVGVNPYNNKVSLIPFSQISDIERKDVDFFIADEIHHLLNGPHYKTIQTICNHARHFLLLSATPIQTRTSEFLKMISLVQPERYLNLSNTEFESMIALQSKISRKAYLCVESYEDLISEINSVNGKHTQDIHDLFSDLSEQLKNLNMLLQDHYLEKTIESLNFENRNFDLMKFRRIISYICQNYQIGNSIIRNRRSGLYDEKNLREVKCIAYDINFPFNCEEKKTYGILCEWIRNVELYSSVDSKSFLNLLHSFFSSSSAFISCLESMENIDIPEKLMDCAKEWNSFEKRIKENLVDYLDDIENCHSRITNVIAFLDDLNPKEKVLLFTDYKETFEYYKEILLDYYGEDACAFFSKEMVLHQREENVYRFQNDEHCVFLLSDKSGGEGRNFQIADYVLHLDLPWKANELEQRIGRLDRIGRIGNRPVVSVVVFSESTLEEDLFRVWNEGINVFQKSQSGLEIIMDELDAAIYDSFKTSFPDGLLEILPILTRRVTDLCKQVDFERRFDVAAYQYSSISRSLKTNLEKFQEVEEYALRKSFLDWAGMVGFGPEYIDSKDVRFTPNTFSCNSARNALFMPPEMKTIIDGKMNQICNKVFAASHGKGQKFDTKYIAGTFDRKRAVLNDYIHFFAPGDEIYDSVIDNAMNSYRGTCCGFSIKKASVSCKGLFFSWKIVYDDFKMLKEGLSFYQINQFRDYLPFPRGIRKFYDLGYCKYDEKDIISEFEKNMRDGCSEVKNLGERHTGNLLLSDSQKQQWKELIDEAYEKSYKELKALLENEVRKSELRLRAEIERQISGVRGNSQFFGEKDDSFLEGQLKQIFDIVAKPVLVLDSVCLVIMEKEKHA